MKTDNRKREQIQQNLQIQPVGMPATDLRVSDCMNPNPKTVTESTSVWDILQLYQTGSFRRLLVVDSAGKLVGIVNEREVISLANRYARGIRTRLQDMTAKQFMNADVLSTNSDTLVLTALRLMLEKGVTFLPVIDAGKLAGIVTSADLYVVLEQLLDPIRQQSQAAAHHFHHKQVEADMSEWLCRT